MMNRYRYEIELKDGTIVTNHNNFNPEDVVRISYIPAMPLFPRHDVILPGLKFKKRFGRGFLKLEHGMKEYLHCAVTDAFRFYLKSSNGQCIITEPNYEMYI